MGPPRRRVPLALLLALLWAAGGCQRTLAPARQPDAVGSPDLPAPEAPPPATSGMVPEAAVESAVELGAYAGDARLAPVVASWPTRVDQALERLRLVTGLDAPVGAAPRVVLAPLGDEHRAYAVGHEVDDGRRRVVVRVNAEVLAPGLGDPARILPAALAEAVMEDASLRHGTLRPWVHVLAATAAAGDADARLVRLRRALAAGRQGGEARVDPADPAVAEATALAALFVLQTRGEAGALRRFLVFAADGDDPDVLLARTLRDPFGRWAGTGRALLVERLRDVDLAPWTLLARAREALDATGPAGLESMLPPTLPWEVEPELRVLRAEAAASVGDWAGVERALDALDVEAWRRLDEPAEAILLRLRAQVRDGGDLARAERLARRWRLDFPRAFARHGADEDVRRALDLDALDALGPEGAPPSLAEAARRAAALLDDHRSGAARRFLEALGERGRAPELALVLRRIAEAEQEPTPEMVAANRARVEAWLLAPGPVTRADVLDGGAAAALALAETLPPARTAARVERVRLMAEAADAGKVVAALAPGWTAAPELLPPDLDALLAVVPWGALRVWVDGLAPDALARAGGDRVWATLGLGLEEDWLREHPDVLRDLRSDAYPTRQAAFDVAVLGAHATPELVAYGLADAAALLRQAAAREAGRAGFRSLVAVALDDGAWVVREEAVRAAALASGREAAPTLRERMATDPAPQVRRAAAVALVDLGGPGRADVDAFVRARSDDDAATADVALAGVLAAPVEMVVAGLGDALDAELRRDPPRSGHLGRLFLLFQKVTGVDPGWHPGLSTAEARRLVARLRGGRSSPRAPGPTGR